MTIEETADFLGISFNTVVRDGRWPGHGSTATSTTTAMQVERCQRIDELFGAPDDLRLTRQKLNAEEEIFCDAYHRRDNDDTSEGTTLNTALEDKQPSGCDS